MCTQACGSQSTIPQVSSSRTLSTPFETWSSTSFETWFLIGLGLTISLDWLSRDPCGSPVHLFQGQDYMCVPPWVFLFVCLREGFSVCCPGCPGSHSETSRLASDSQRITSQMWSSVMHHHGLALHLFLHEIISSNIIFPNRSLVRELYNLFLSDKVPLSLRWPELLILLSRPSKAYLLIFWDEVFDLPN